MPATSERVLAVVALVLAASCDRRHGDRDQDAAPPPPEPEPTTLTRFDDPPGVAVEVLSVTGASGADGSFRSGDRVAVRFRLEKSDGSPWGLAEMSESAAMLSGPTFSYQRVLAEVRDVTGEARANSDGSFTYTFAAPIPSAYLAPLNDSASFDADDGELAGQNLLAGTYTVGLGFVWSYSVEGATYHDVGEATFDVRFGGAASVQPRRVTQTENCNACHVERTLAHEGKRRSLEVCVLCHTAGAEDLNDLNVAGGTPGRSVELKVMLHKLHNGRHLPSVNGVATDALGNTLYGQTPRPYVLADSVTGAHDYSDVGFPAWPNRAHPMPRDFGYSSLSATDQASEDVMSAGVTRCDACHGDPDGSGPIAAPAQGDLIRAQPSRRACGACHDDVDFAVGLHRNQQDMPPQLDDSGCYECHTPDGGGFFSPLAIADAHTHPLLDPLYTGTTFLDFTTFRGLHLDVLGVSEAGASNGDGTIDPGEKVQVQLSVKDDTGAAFPLAKLGAITAVISGPSSNANLVHEVLIPRSLLTGAQPFTLRVPEVVRLEFVGRSTGALGDVFVTAKSPHFTTAGAQTSVRVRTGTSGGSSVLASSARAPQNFADVADASGFARGDVIVLDDGVASREEYLEVQFVDGERLWFSSPETPSFKAGISFDHPSGATVREVQLTLKNASAFSLVASTGTITELQEFGAGNAVLVSSTTEFVMPQVFGIAANGSPDLGEESGKWQGLALVPGTYRLWIGAWCDLDLNANGEDNFYRYASESESVEFLVGGASSLEPYSLVDDSNACNACHAELSYHSGSYRGFEACIACHGNAGAEDRPRYVAANAPPTDGVTVNFRSLLHTVHRGRDAANAGSFGVVGSSTAAYPDNFSVNSFDDVGFPARPGASAQCAKCHGASNISWRDVAERFHPTEGTVPAISWRTACAACHDSTAAAAHFDLQTSAGIESCVICHGPGNVDAIDVVHRGR